MALPGSGGRDRVSIEGLAPEAARFGRRLNDGMDADAPGTGDGPECTEPAHSGTGEPPHSAVRDPRCSALSVAGKSAQG